MNRNEIIREAKTAGTPGKLYWWHDVDRRAVQSCPYTMPDGRVIHIPEPGKYDYSVEVHHPNGRIEYV